MQPDLLPATITDRLHQPELRLLLDGLDIRSDATLAEPFILAGAGRIVLGGPILSAAGDSFSCAMRLNWAGSPMSRSPL